MSLRLIFASICNLWRQLFRNLGMKITTIVWVDSKNNGWLPWIPFPQTTDPLRLKRLLGKHDQECRRILTPAHGPLGSRSLCSNLSGHCWKLRDRHLWFPDSKTMIFITRNYRVGMGIFFTKAQSSAPLSLRYMSSFISCGTAASLSIFGGISHEISHFQKSDLSLTSLISLQWKTKW